MDASEFVARLEHQYIRSLGFLPPTGLEWIVPKRLFDDKKAELLLLENVTEFENDVLVVWFPFGQVNIIPK